MLENFPEEKKNILLEYPFIRNYLEDRNIKKFLEHLGKPNEGVSFYKELLSKGIEDGYIQSLINMFNEEKGEKITIISDTHDNHFYSKDLFDYIKSGDIKIVLDCGDMDNGRILCKFEEKIEVYSPFMADNMFGWRRYEELKGSLEKVGGKIFIDPALFTISNNVFWVQHALSELPTGKEFEVSDERVNEIRKKLKEFKGYNKYILFGHTHQFHVKNEGDITIINPGSFAHFSNLIELNLKTRDIKYISIKRGATKPIIEFPNHSKIKSITLLSDSFSRAYYLFKIIETDGNEREEIVGWNDALKSFNIIDPKTINEKDMPGRIKFEKIDLEKRRRMEELMEAQGKSLY